MTGGFLIKTAALALTLLILSRCYHPVEWFDGPRPEGQIMPPPMIRGTLTPTPTVTPTPTLTPTPTPTVRPTAEAAGSRPYTAPSRELATVPPGCPGAGSPAHAGIDRALAGRPQRLQLSPYNLPVRGRLGLS